MVENEISGIAIDDTPLGRKLAEMAANKEQLKNQAGEVISETTETVVEKTEPVVEQVVEVVEKSAETVVEVKEEAPVEEVVEARKNALDLLKDEETVVVEDKKTLTLEDLPADIKAEIEFAKKLKSNPLLELFEKGATEQDLIEFAKAILPKDNSTLPLSELVKIDFEKELGLSGDDLDTAVSEYLEEVNSMPLWKQKQTENQLRSKFKPQGSDVNGYLAKWKEAAEANKPIAPPSQEQIDAEIKTIVETDKSQITEICTNLVGAEFEGVVLSDAEVKEVIESYDFNEASFKYVGKDGKFNVKKYVQEKLQTSPTVIQKRIEAAVAAERAKLLKEFGGVDKKPDGGSFNQGTAPINQSKAALEAMLGRTITT